MIRTTGERGGWWGKKEKEKEEMKEGERERGRKKGQGRILEIFGKSI